jgi:KDO2-lipid IV(A) lauroyltransferase
MLLYLAFHAATTLVRLLPVRVSYACARAAGTLAYLAWPGGRRRCVDNMRHVTGGDERLARRYARRSFANYAVYMIDFFRMPSASPREIEERVQFDDWELLEEERSGNGVVFVTMHVGNWDLGAAILALRGFPVVVIADRFANRRLNALVLGSRERLGVTIIPADRMGPGILRALRRNDLVAVLADIPQRERGIEVQFFGGTIAVSDGPARIALRAGASVVAAMARRLDPWSDRVAGDISPVAFEPTGETEHDVHALTQALFAHLEPLVRRSPDQWYIFRHLWVADAAAARPA